MRKICVGRGKALKSAPVDIMNTLAANPALTDLFPSPAAAFAEVRDEFLAKIRRAAPTQTGQYKQVLASPLRYAGGKSRAVGYVVAMLPNNLNRLVSPFFGGGSVEIACNRHFGLPVVGYDVFDILANYWRVQLSRPKDLAAALAKIPPTRESYAAVKAELKAHWKGEKKLRPFSLAAHYYFNHNLSYGPGFLGWPSSVYMDEGRYGKMLAGVRDFRAPGLSVGQADFEAVFKRHPRDFFYCDPPYLLGDDCGDSRMFRGIYPQRNFPIHHDGFDHEKLRDLLRAHRGGFILSYNNCPTVRRWYSNRQWGRELQIQFPKWQYTLGQGETRIGENRVNGKANHVKQSHEILVFCPPK